MVSILAIIGVFFAPVVMIVLIVWFRSKEKRQRYLLQAELYAKALEKGQSVPADLFAEPKKKHNPLNTGIICISVGVGIALCFVLIYVLAGADMKVDALILFRLIGSLSIIPFFIGVAFLIIHFIEKGKTVDENAK